MKPNISLILPVLNEEELIFETVETFNKQLKKICSKYEIIIIDDGSTDSTAKILKKIKKRFSRVRVVTHQRNLGVGRAILNGFAIAKMEWVVTNSADRPFDINDLVKVKSLFSKYDVIVAVRTDRSANPFFRKITSFSSYLLLKFCFSIPIHDFHFVQIYKREKIEGIKVYANDTFAPAELLVKCYHKGLRIGEFPAKFHRRTAGVSKYNNPVKYVIYLKDLFYFWLRLRGDNL